MRARINAEAFYDAMKKVSGALRRSAIPSLEQIRVDFENGVCRLTASDLTLWLSVEIPAEGDSFSFMFSNTANAVRACRYYGGDLTVELCGGGEDMKASFCAESKSGVFSVQDVSMCPTWPNEKPQQHYVLDAPALLERIKKVKYAVLLSDSKPAFAGVRFDRNHVWCVDGLRLALNDDPSLTVERSFILPCYALAQLKLFDAGDTDLCISPRYAWFSSADTKLLIRRLVAADELRIENVVPAHSAESYWVDRKKLSDAIDYLDGCSRDMPRPYVFFNGRELILNNGGFEYSVLLKADGASQIRYAFDLTKMKDALKQFADEKKVRICVSSKTAPIVLRGDGPNTALLLPVRLSSNSQWNAA